MNLNWYKWIDNLLPVNLRKILIQEFLYLLSYPLRQIYGKFVNWSNETKLKAIGTPQVCMLEKIVYDSLGINIKIVEGDGQPMDFIIKTAFVDLDKERQLFSLIDRYKLAGKSYDYENTDVQVIYRWEGMFCELADVAWKWSGFLCESLGKIKTTIFVDILNSRMSFFVYSSPNVPYANVHLFYHCVDRTGEVYSPRPYHYQGSGRRQVILRDPLLVDYGFTMSPTEDTDYIYSLVVRYYGS